MRPAPNQHHVDVIFVSATETCLHIPRGHPCHLIQGVAFHSLISTRFSSLISVHPSDAGRRQVMMKEKAESNRQRWWKETALSFLYLEMMNDLQSRRLNQTRTNSSASHKAPLIFCIQFLVFTAILDLHTTWAIKARGECQEPGIHTHRSSVADASTPKVTSPSQGAAVWYGIQAIP